MAISIPRLKISHNDTILRPVVISADTIATLTLATNMPDNAYSAFAALVGDNRIDVDLLVADFVHSLKQRGWNVKGLVQTATERTDRCNRDIDLLDLDGRDRYRISQNLGPGSDSCCVDATGVASAAVVLRRALAEKVDLAVANRFGKLEAEGDGLCAEFLALMSEGIPVLTIVAEKHLERWQHFTGNTSALLEPRLDALEKWFSGLHGEVRRC